MGDMGGMGHMGETDVTHGATCFFMQVSFYMVKIDSQWEREKGILWFVWVFFILGGVCQLVFSPAEFNIKKERPTQHYLL